MSVVLLDPHQADDESLQTSQSSTAVKQPGHRFWQFGDSSTLSEMEERIGHLQRVSQGLSEAKITPIPDRFPIAKAGGHTDAELIGQRQKEFLQADLDGDGALSKQELKYAMEKHWRPLTETEAQSIIFRQTSHAAGTSSLSFEQYLNLCSNLEQKKRGPSKAASSVSNQMPNSAAAPAMHDPENYETAEKFYGCPSCTWGSSDQRQKQFPRPNEGAQVPSRMILVQQQQRIPPAGPNDRNQIPSQETLKVPPARSQLAPYEPSAGNSLHRTQSAVSRISRKVEPGTIQKTIEYFESKIRHSIDEAEANRAMNHRLNRAPKPAPHKVAPPPTQTTASVKAPSNYDERDGREPPMPPPMPAKPLYAHNPPPPPPLSTTPSSARNSPPPPPPMPSTPLFVPAQPAGSSTSIAKPSQSATSLPPQPPPLPTEENQPQRSRSRQRRLKTRQKSSKFGDRRDELQILQASTDASQSSVPLGSSKLVETAEEATEVKPEQQEQRRYSEPVPSGSKKNVEKSYHKERLVAEQRSMAVGSEMATPANARSRPSSFPLLQGMFNKGPNALNQNYFKHPQVYKGVPQRKKEAKLKEKVE